MLKFKKSLSFLLENLNKIKYSYVTLEKDIAYNNLVLQLFFNSNCNAKCKFCGVRHLKAEEIAPEVLYDYLLPLYDKTKVIIPTFGEYTISQNCYNFLSFIAENYPQINIFTETNGINFNEKWQDFSIKNIVRTACSLNAINAKRYQETVWQGQGGEIVYDKIINNLKSYQQKLKDNNMEAFGTRLSMVLNPSNYNDIADFVKLSLELGSMYVTFFFDNSCLELSESKSKERRKALKTLIELEKLLQHKYFIFFKLYTPFTINDIHEVEKEVALISMEELQTKYADVYELAKDRDYLKEYQKRTEIRKTHNKKPLSLLEEFSITGSQHNINGTDTKFCTVAHHHLVVYPNGRIRTCAWEDFAKCLCLKSPNIKDFIKNKSINWNKVFNGFYYKLVRNFVKRGNYKGCPKVCPFRNNYFKEVFQDIIDK